MAHPPRGPARGSRGGGNGTAVAASRRGSDRGGRGGSRGARGASATANPVGLLQALRSQQQQAGQAAAATAAAATSKSKRGTSFAARGGPTASTRGSARLRGKSQVQWTDASKKQFAGQIQRTGAPRDTNKPVQATSTTPNPKLEEQGKDRFEWLKEQRKRERAQGIADGLLHDPNKKRTLETAITPVGTCEDMCPEFERVERVQRHEVDRCEKTRPDEGGTAVPAAERMVKKFVRSDAGREEQLPSDIRTPDALVRTMDYLIEDVIGKEERLIACHNFIWDRTRAVRNDFSIQQVSAESAVRMAVDCHERSARFLILSLHILSDEAQLRPGDHFDAQQDVEQLNKTFTSLWHYYDSHRDTIVFPNEAEFRSYQILFEILSATPDLEDRMHLWPYDVLADASVQTALRLYQAANDTLRYRGPLRPFTPDMVAQMNACAFWDLLTSPCCSYLMACVAEMSFYLVRFGFLAVLRKSVKSAPKAQQERMREWTVSQMREYLSFDDDEQVIHFCSGLGIDFLGTNDNGDSYIDFSRDSSLVLELENVPRKQIFSNSIVEVKRLHRTYISLINGKTASEAIETYDVVEDEGASLPQPQADLDEEHSMFFPETSKAISGPTFQSSQPPQQVQEHKIAPVPAFGSGMFQSGLNPTAKPFEAGPGLGKQLFGQALSSDNKSPGFSFPSSFGSGASKLSVSDPSPATFAATFGSFKSSSTLASPAAQSSNAADSSAAPFDSSKPFGSTQNSPTDNAFYSRSADPTVATSASSATPPPPSPFFGNKASSSSGFIFNNPFATSSESASQLSLTTAKGPLFAESNKAQPFHSLGDIAKTSDAALESGEIPRPKLAPSFPPVTPQAAQPFTWPQPPKDDPSSQTSESETSHPLQPSLFLSTAPEPEDSRLKSSQDGSEKPAAIFTFSPQVPSTSTTQRSPPESEVTTPPLFNSQPPELPQSQPSTQKAAFNFKPTLPTPPSPTPIFPTNKAAPLLTTTPPSSPPKSEASKQQELIALTARLALTQPKGLMHEFLEYTLENILPSLLEEHIAEVSAQKLARLKASLLRRKFGPLWRRLAYESSLNRRAAERRKRFAQSLKMEVDKKRKRDEELNEIISAMEDSKRIKAEQERVEQEAAEKAKNAQGANDTKAVQKEAHLIEIKKKGSGMTVSAELQPPIRAVPDPLRHHKRARSSGVALPISHRPAQPAPSCDFRASIFSAGNSSISQLGRSRNLRDSQRSRSFAQSQQQDNTHTDFFRLLAHNVDPETPLIPLTQAQIEAKAKKEKEEREARLSSMYNRRKVPVGTAKPQPSPRPPQAQPAQPPKHSSTVSHTSSTSDSTPFDPDSDDLIRQIRETNKLLAEGSDWFKEQISTLCKEDPEARAPSLPTTQWSSQTSAYVSTNGEYPTRVSKPSISRAEQLIRSYGLDKPMTKYGIDSFPVPASQHVGRFQVESLDEPANAASRKNKTISSLPDPRFEPGQSEDEAEFSDKRPTSVARPKPRPYINNANPYSRLQQGLEDDEEDNEDLREDEEEDYEDDDDDQDLHHYYYHNTNNNSGKSVVGSEADDDELLENDEDEDEDEEDDDEGQEEEGDYEEEEGTLDGGQGGYHDSQYYHRQAYPGRGDGDGDSDEYGNDAPTPATQVSGSAGPGATKEDAIALSDSD